MSMKPRILVVDDEPYLCLLYRAALSDEGYEVKTAGGGVQALEEMGAFKPDLVVMDIRMLDMDGIETMGRMLNRKRDLPVILHTAYASHKDNFCSWPASAYIIKSSDLSELIRTIQELLSGAGPRSISQAA